MTTQPVVGADGCRGGWFWVRITGPSFEVGVSGNVDQLCKRHMDAARICIDIPIGLPNCSERRRCDTEARRLLGPKASSVFSAPCRQVLGHTDYVAACEASRIATGRALSKQSFSIVPKIREVDHFLRGHRHDIDRLIEAHPEVCFLGMADTPMKHSKKRSAGTEERLDVLQTLWPDARSCFAVANDRFPRAEVSRDDIVDAIACALTAHNSESTLALPDTPQVDSEGLPMRITYFKPPVSRARA